jgi:hypothetical protein
MSELSPLSGAKAEDICSERGFPGFAISAKQCWGGSGNLEQSLDHFRLS